MSTRADVFSASAAAALEKAREYRDLAEYARRSQSGHKHGATEPTRYRHFCMAATLAFEARAETEDRIAALYNAAARSWPKAAP